MVVTVVDVVGETVGDTEGASVGMSVEGASVGVSVTKTVGKLDGDAVITAVGELVTVSASVEPSQRSHLPKQNNS